MNETSVAQALGDLQGTVRAMAEQWRQQETAATEGRHALRDKVEELKTEVTRMTGRVDQLSVDVAEIKPAVKTIEAKDHRGQGERNIIRIIWGILIAGISAVAYVISDWVHLLWPPRGH